MRRRARLHVTLTRVPCPRAPAQMTSGAGSRRAPGRAETVEAAPDLTSWRAGDYVGPTIPREAPDAEHEGLLRAQASARGEDHRQDHAPRARRRQGDGRLVVHDGGCPRRRPPATARAGLLDDLGEDGVPPRQREAELRAGRRRRPYWRRLDRGEVTG